MRKQKWKKWVMAAGMMGMLVGQTGFLTVQAANMSEAGVQEEIQGREIEVAALSEVSEEQEEVQALGITYTVDGDTVTITGEGTLADFPYEFWIGLQRAKHVKFVNCKITGTMDNFFGIKEEDTFVVESIDLSGLDTSNVTDMWGMFSDCRNLMSVDMSGIDTGNVMNMSAMFAGCSSLTNVDVSGFDTSNVLDMANMFAGCSSLTNVDVSGFDTSNVMYMYRMFADCGNLTNVDVSGFDTSNVERMDSMFADCSNLTNVDASGFDTSNVKWMDSMFAGCSSLTNVDVSGFDTSNVEQMNSMFAGCSSLVNIDLSSFDLSRMAYMINGYVISNAADMLSGTNITVLKTPHILGKGFIDLSATFIDPIGRETNQVTADFCNTTLIRKGADAPVIPNPTPVPITPPISTPTPVPTPGPVVDEETRDNVNNFVFRMYTVALNRDSEPAGQEYWANRLLSHDTDGAGIAHGFIMGEEFENQNLTNEEFVDVLYRTFFNREEVPEEQAYWLAKLAVGNSRGYVLSGFVNSVEFDMLCDSYGIIRGKMREDGIPCNPGIRPFVERQYTKVLNRAGVRGEIDYWTDEIVSGRHTPEDVAKRFFQSEEFAYRNLNDSDYVETLYETFLDRPSGPEEKVYWLQQISNGMDRGAVLEGFSKSSEFAGIVAGYGL